MQLSRSSFVAPARASRRTAVRVAAKHDKNGPRVAIVGITGAVGQEFLTVSGAWVALGVGVGVAGRPGRRCRPLDGADGPLHALRRS